MRRTTLALAALFGVASMAGCEGNGGSKASPNTTAAATASPQAAATATATGSAAGPAAAAPRSPFAGKWQGGFKAAPAEIVIPKGVRYTAWKADDGKQAVGDGSVELAIDDAGQVTGKTTGALGEMTVTGALDGDVLRAALVPVDPAAELAMRGTLMGTATKESLEAVLQVANHDAVLVRRANFKLTRP